ncbi:hypothetical protein [Photobacterium damselae]|uniref:hypothetical protein n=1 Tax=Photobacterium damselae TaxID=38293 RepID=UPI001F3EC149|nr:hypothetical protein [Photobacterium damselae]UKA03970.1 hypothetical protein IHC89_15690 [Photobacterium damselae subsp. damselae]
MIFNQSDVITSFVKYFDGLAAIRNYEGKYLLTNLTWQKQIGSKEGQYLEDIMDFPASDNMATNLNHCRKYDDSVIYHNQPIYNFEFFKKKRYITMRFPINYKNQNAILILGTIHK